MAYISFQPNDYFNTKLWSGNSSTQAITGVGFQPDFVWGKQRSSTQSHQLLDAIRGANNILVSNTNAAAVADSNILNSFDSDGFTLGNQDQLNDTGATYVSWNWKANGAGSSNTDGNLTSTVSANTTAGFSIVKYTSNGSGTTIGHGLGQVPDAILLKNTSQAENWVGNFSAIHSASGNGNNLYLNLTNANGSDIQTVTARDSTTFTCANFGNPANSSSAYNYIAYCFAEKTGFSKFGSYTGNGSTDGTFVYTGFKPAFVIIKGSSNTENWHMYDNKRDTGNPTDQALQPNTNSAEWTETNVLDFLSNGFKLRISGGGHNGSGVSYIYMAFAEEPLVSSNGVPAVAR